MSTSSSSSPQTPAVSSASSSLTAPTIRHRPVPSRRRRDGLVSFACNVTSQHGEDGILQRLFELLPPPKERTMSYCVDVGAWDGKHWSQTFNLLKNDDPSNGAQGSARRRRWKGILIEADPDRFQELQVLYDHHPQEQEQQPNDHKCLNVAISCLEGHVNSLGAILTREYQQGNLPLDFDLCSIDIDGSDYWALHSLWTAQPTTAFRPQVVVIEFNPTMPSDLIYIPPRTDTMRHGASLAALVELAQQFDYILVETTMFNAFFVPRALYRKYLRDLVPDTSIEALSEITMSTSVYQLYDGTLKLWGCKKLLWHRLPMEEEKIQMLPPDQRNFPFAPAASPATSKSFDQHDETLWQQAIDISPFCVAPNDHDAARSLSIQQRNTCAATLLKALQNDGFCLVRGTRMDPALCHDALELTRLLLQQADESVRRSCLSKLDRARRGYSPMSTENFASLIGQERPNDLVSKFRIGPSSVQSTNRDTAATGVASDSDASFSSATTNSSLLSPNIWPQDWEFSEKFQSIMEQYYEEMDRASRAIVQALCHGLIQHNADLKTVLEPFVRLSRPDQDRTLTTPCMTSSILTLLGYRVGSRHKGKNKGPLVAAHTDVAVITVLLFDASSSGENAKDGGSCATLQRSDGKGGWINVELPNASLHNDPVFVVNVGDCFSEVVNIDGSDQDDMANEPNQTHPPFLPSTLHRVIAGPGRRARNCCAFFVGLDPKERLSVRGQEMTYEEWRKQRIARAQSVLHHQIVSAPSASVP